MNTGINRSTKQTVPLLHIKSSFSSETKRLKFNFNVVCLVLLRVVQMSSAGMDDLLLVPALFEIS